MCKFINLNIICNVIYFNTFCSEIGEFEPFKLMLIQHTPIKKSLIALHIGEIEFTRYRISRS